MKAFKIPVVIALLASANLAYAGSIRCGEEVIQDGGENPPTMEEVIEKCGEPTERGLGVLIYRDKNAQLEFDDDGQLAVIHQLD